MAMGQRLNTWREAVLMVERKSIPDDYYENDIGPDPKYAKMTPKGFDDDLRVTILENAKKAKRSLGHSSDHLPEPPPPSERSERK